MKQFIVLALVILLASCQQKKLDRMQQVQDSLEQVAATKDDAISDFIGTMNEIQSNLDSIKKLEKIVNIKSNNAEPQSNDRQQILKDIAMINELLQKNKELIASQRKKLDLSSNKMQEMQNMLDRMNSQLESKDTEISTLRTEVEKLENNISSLNENLAEAQERAQEQSLTIEEKTSTINEQVKAMNTGYYVFGTAKELVENGIVEKEGGFLGIGRTLKFRRDFNPDLFTEIDIREVKEINLNTKKAEIITTHPAESYEFIGDDPIEKLVIQDPREFWATSKYLVINVK